MEYFLFHNPSRHYTFTNVLSKRSLGEVRTPSFDNKLYDFYLSLPLDLRLNSYLSRKAMMNSSFKLGLIPAGNYGLPAFLSPIQKNIFQAGRKIIREISFLKKFKPPSAEDRTWPDRDRYMQSHPIYLEKIIDSLNDASFQDHLDFFNWKYFMNNLNVSIKEPFFSAYLISLLSYQRMFREIV